MNTQKEINELLDKMSNKKNFLSLDEVYLEAYRESSEVKYLGKSVIADINQIPSLIKATLVNAGIKTSSNLNHSLLYLEVPKTTPFEEIIEFNITAEDYMSCPFNYAVGRSDSTNTTLSIVARAETTLKVVK